MPKEKTLKQVLIQTRTKTIAREGFMQFPKMLYFDVKTCNRGGWGGGGGGGGGGGEAF